MALTLAIVPGYDARSVGANMPVVFVAQVTNAGSSSVTLQSLTTGNADPSVSVSVGQPGYLTGNVPVGVGNPVLSPGVTYSYPFMVTFLAPGGAGPSPQAPGTTLGSQLAQPTDAQFAVSLSSLSSDATSASTTLLVPVLSAIAPYPVALGGGMQLSSGFNLVNLLTSFG